MHGLLGRLFTCNFFYLHAILEVMMSIKMCYSHVRAATFGNFKTSFASEIAGVKYL